MKYMLTPLLLAQAVIIACTAPAHALQNKPTNTPIRSSVDRTLISNSYIIEAKKIQQDARAYNLGLRLAVQKGLVDRQAHEYYTWTFVGTMFGRGKTLEDACLWADCDPAFAYRLLRLGQNAFALAEEDLAAEQRQQELTQKLQLR